MVIAIELTPKPMLSMSRTIPPAGLTSAQELKSSFDAGAAGAGSEPPHPRFIIKAIVSIPSEMTLILFIGWRPSALSKMLALPLIHSRRPGIEFDHAAIDCQRSVLILRYVRHEGTRGCRASAECQNHSNQNELIHASLIGSPWDGLSQLFFD